VGRAGRSALSCKVGSRRSRDVQVCGYFFYLAFLGGGERLSTIGRTGVGMGSAFTGVQHPETT